MAVRFRIILIVLGINLGTILGVPIITTPEGSEYVIDSKDNLELVCESVTPITWSYPTIDGEEDQFPTSINIEVKDSRKDDVYVSKLEITNASDLNVGYYYCNETANPNNHASIYLYVNDDEVLYVGRKDPIVVSGKQYSPLVIPCRPTSPTVDVKLYYGVGIDSNNEVFMSVYNELAVYNIAEFMWKSWSVSNHRIYSPIILPTFTTGGFSTTN